MTPVELRVLLAKYGIYSGNVRESDMQKLIDELEGTK